LPEGRGELSGGDRWRAVKRQTGIVSKGTSGG
jgi:hypothetical protein